MIPMEPSELNMLDPKDLDEFRKRKGILCPLRAVKISSTVSDNYTWVRSMLMSLHDLIMSSHVVDWQDESLIIGYLAAIKLQGRIQYGYSLLNPNDAQQYSRRMGQRIAVGRALKGWGELLTGIEHEQDPFIISSDGDVVWYLPVTIATQIHYFRKRANRYFTKHNETTDNELLNKLNTDKLHDCSGCPYLKQALKNPVDIFNSNSKLEDCKDDSDT